MAQRDERWYSGRWKLRSQHNERAWQQTAVKQQRLADEGGGSAEKLEATLLLCRQHLLGWRDQ